MTCDDSRTFTNSAYDIPITISSKSNITVSDIDDIEIVMTNISNTAVVKTFTKSAGNISILGSDITLHLNDNDITVAGHYHIAVTITDFATKQRIPNVCKETRFFEDQ